MIPVWDLLGYLGSIQLLLLLNLRSLISTNPVHICSNRTLFLFFAATTACFWLVWGGYSVDAWRYLARFDYSALHFREEQIFWNAGYVLNKLVPDPWPLKILSACSVLILCWAYYRYFGSADTPELTITFMLLLVTPAFFLLTGNAIRQGLAGSVGVLAAVYFLQRGYLRWLVLVLISFFIHQTAVLIAMALLVVGACRGFLFWIWLGSFFVSPVATSLFSAFGHDLGEYIRYANFSEGFFHWAKLAVSTTISLVVLTSFRLLPAEGLDFRHAYIGLVILSNSLLIYEVPFERFLLFADLFAAPALAQLLVHGDWLPRRYLFASVLTVCGSVLLWTHQSIVKTLGYF